MMSRKGLHRMVQASFVIQKALPVKLTKKGFVWLACDFVLAAHIHPERLWDIHRTVRIEVIFQKGNQHAGRGDHGVIQGMGKIVALFFVFDPDAQPARLRVP